MTATTPNGKPDTAPSTRPANRWAAWVDDADWAALTDEVNDYGCALMPQLLTPEECAHLAGLYEEHERSRSTVDMARHQFCEGEYHYLLPQRAACPRQQRVRRGSGVLRRRVHRGSRRLPPLRGRPARAPRHLDVPARRTIRLGPKPVPLRAAYTAARRRQDRFGPLDQLGSLVLGDSRDQTERDAVRLRYDLLVTRGVEVRDVVD